MLGLLTLELEQDDYQVQSYASAEEALATQLGPPDLAVLDYQLPGMDGLVLLEQLRQHYPTFPVLMISSECTLECLPTDSSLTVLTTYQFLMTSPLKAGKG